MKGLIVITMLVVCMLASCTRDKTAATAPIAAKGVMDVSGWDFQENGPIALKGEWLFYWEQLVSPQLIKQETAAQFSGSYIQAPGIWNKAVVSGMQLPGIGYATYRLQVKIGEPQKGLGLKFFDMSSACRVWVDDNVVYQAGVPGDTKETTTARYSPGVVAIDASEPGLDIIIQVSNFHHWMGGMWQPVIIGKTSDLHAIRDKSLFTSSLLFGAIWIIGFYHISLFGIWKKDKTPLLFGVFCLLIGMRAALHDERYIVALFPSISFSLLTSLVYLTIYLAVPCFIWYLRMLFPEEMPDLLNKWVMIVSSFFILSVIVLPSRWFTPTLPVFQVFMVILALICTLVVLRVVVKRKTGSVVFLTGFLVFAAAVINDILYTRYILFTGYFIPAGLMFFLFTQAFLISQRYSMAFKTISQQGIALKAENRQRQQVENHLRKSEEKYRQMVEHLPIPVGEYDFNYNVLYANQAALDWFGFTRQELKAGINASGLIPEESAELIASRMQFLAKGKVPSSVDVMVRKKDGTPIWGQATPSLIFREGTPVAIRTCFMDLSERREHEKAMLYAAEQEKYALVGQVAGKMAHDFNNILSAIMGTTELSLMDCRDEDVKEALQIILEQSERGTTLTRNLVAFAKDQELKEELFDINEKVSLVVNLLKKELKGISLKLNCEDHIPLLLADPGMVEHALVNLLQNAIHATSMETVPEIIITTRTDGRSVFIEIVDNGCGIPQEYQKDIYTPAFTLKGGNDQTQSYKTGIKGTGYGMANVKKYIDRHNGTIRFNSREDKGTCFEISFPIVEKKLSENEKTLIEKRPIVQGKRILVVEDEPAISGIQSRILTDSPFCHDVRVAVNGQEAVALFDSDAFDLVSLDYVLDGNETGMDVYRHIRVRNPVVPVIFVSGNIRFLRSMEQLRAGDPNVDHLPKPYKNMTYAYTVNDWLVRQV